MKCYNFEVIKKTGILDRKGKISWRTLADPNNKGTFMFVA